MFVNFSPNGAEIQGPIYNQTYTPNYLDWGWDPGQPVYGAVVLPETTIPAGHGAFVAGQLDNGTLIMLGGNQSSKVGYSALQGGYRNPQFRLPIGYAPRPWDYQLPRFVWGGAGVGYVPASP